MGAQRKTQNRKMVLRHGGAPLVTESKGGGKTRDKKRERERESVYSRGKPSTCG